MKTPEDLEKSTYTGPMAPDRSQRTLIRASSSACFGAGSG